MVLLGLCLGFGGFGFFCLVGFCCCWLFKFFFFFEREREYAIFTFGDFGLLFFIFLFVSYFYFLLFSLRYYFDIFPNLVFPAPRRCLLCSEYCCLMSVITHCSFQLFFFSLYVLAYPGDASLQSLA